MLKGSAAQHRDRRHLPVFRCLAIRRVAHRRHAAVKADRYRAAAHRGDRRPLKPVRDILQRKDSVITAAAPA